MSECMYHRSVLIRALITFLTPAILFLSCNKNSEDFADTLPDLYPPPLTGDNIQPIINSVGDVVQTGVNMMLSGHILYPEITGKPADIPAGIPSKEPIDADFALVPEKGIVIHVNKDSLMSFTPGRDIYKPFSLVNSSEDIIPTGVPLPVSGKVVPCRMPLPVEALLPRLRENARINMKYLDLEQGMNSLSLNKIMEDREGNFWVGTTEKLIHLQQNLYLKGMIPMIWLPYVAF